MRTLFALIAFLLVSLLAVGCGGPTPAAGTALTEENRRQDTKSKETSPASTPEIAKSNVQTSKLEAPPPSPEVPKAARNKTRIVRSTTSRVTTQTPTLQIEDSRGARLANELFNRSLDVSVSLVDAEFERRQLNVRHEGR